ncbi:AAA family ATPase [Hymenobacter sp. DG25B]|uniref:AAA family ATPase n=1 Tax=Hymenobacter sp. DG25B TaxID=1385664 RepID=UPI00090058B4|nr:AAA family ATPase [Hymenobacter sp. DG25B]
MVAFFKKENNVYYFDNESEDAFEGFRFESYMNMVYFTPINKVNILIGANNSGKSRFMRAIIKNNSIITTNENSIINKLKQLSDLARKAEDILPNEVFLNFQTTARVEITDQIIINESHKRLLLRNREPQDYPISRESVINSIKHITSSFYTMRGAGLKAGITLQSDILIIAYNIYILNKDKVEKWGIFPFEGLSKTLSYEIFDDSEEIINLLQEISSVSSEIADIKINNDILNKIYIPILRSARTLHTSNLVSSDIDKSVLNDTISSIFKFTIAQDYSLPLNDTNLQIETGLNLFSLIKDANNSLQHARRPFKAFVNFISINFFNGKHVELIAPPAEGIERENIAVEIEDEERPIQYLGDGVQSLLIMLYPIFTAKPNSWIFIEEPETHLHPGLQRIFLETIINDPTIISKNLTIFFTTHSNHLLSVSLEEKQDINIFTFEKIKIDNKSVCDIRAVKSKDLTILNKLEVHNSSVFISNCSIWVEGPTDRIYFRIYLNNYIKKYKKPIIHEDLHYSFLEYAGSNLSHYIFQETEDDDMLENEKLIKTINALSIANRIILISDSDSGKEKKHENLKKQISKNFSYYRIPVREVENLLSPKSLSDIIPKAIKKIRPEDMNRISFNESEYKDIYMGNYLKSKLPIEKLPKGFTAESGTLSTLHKNSFAKYASNHVSWDDMTESAQDLAKELYTFISKHNYIDHDDELQIT